jgi:membrane dipeptidase
VILIGGRIVLGLLLKPDPPTHTPEEEALRERALDLHHDATLFDGHNDVLTWIVNYGYDLGMDGDEPDDRSPFLYAGGPFTWLPNPPQGEKVRAHMDLTRVREGGLDAQFFSIWVDCSFYESGVPGGSEQRALEMIEALRLQVQRYSEAIEVAYTAQDVQRIASEGKLAALMGVEGGYAIEDNLEILRRFHEIGVRYMTLTHNCSHSWADSSSDEGQNGGLTGFGHQVVREMNNLGMIVDISHVSDETFWDVVEVTKAPIIASHSNARAIAVHPRNLTDDMIRAVAAKNGVVMVNFIDTYLDPEKTPAWKAYSGWHWLTHPRQPGTPLSVLIDHIDHIVQIAGIDHVGLGSDFDGAPFLPEGLKDVGDFPNITVALLRHGYSEEDIRKILGGNILRELTDVEAVAAQP